MAKSHILPLMIAFTAVAGMARAQTLPQSPADVIAAMPKGLERAKGPALDPSIAAARAAVDACAANGHKVSALIVDSVGIPVVLLSGDGAGYRSQLIAKTKTDTVVKYHISSAVVAEKAKTDTKLAAELAADPNIGMARGGGVPIVIKGEFLGAFAVSGAFGPDQECVDAALAKVTLR